MSDETLNMRVTADTAQAQRAFTSLGDKFNDFAFKAGAVVLIGKQVFRTLEDIYKTALQGSKLIGGEVAESYKEFDDGLKALTDSGKILLAEVLYPIAAGGGVPAGLNAINDALDEGQISWLEYAGAGAQLISFRGIFDREYRDAIIEGLGLVDKATEDSGLAFEILKKKALDLGNIAEGEFDGALGAGLSNISAWAISAAQNVGFLESAFRKLGLTGFDVEMMLIDMREEQGLLTEEQAENERAILRLAEMIDNGLIVSLDDLKGVLQDGKLTWEEYRGLIQLNEETTRLLEDSLNAAAAEAKEMQDILNGIDGEYNATINITVTGDPIPSFNNLTNKGTGGVPLHHGADFTVPAGYPNDSYGPLYVESGERVQVTPAGASAPPGGGGGDTIIVMIDGEEVAAHIERRQGRSFRMARNSGAAVTGR